uniref:ATP synthase complex subunit 8 n=1 Tax=Loxoblemmus doenitzi TaxID=209185 RepID=A0A7L9QCI4_9ORTH|nr:ATP synthase F0 subunit 8 [Loxoblemmus doenitzi]
MPQMAPMSWLSLMIFFILILIIMMTMNYFLFQPSITTQNKTLFKSYTNNWER